MEDYTKLYHLLFNAITDALEQMNAQNFGSAKETLVSAQAKSRRNLYHSRGLKKEQPERGEQSNAARTQSAAVLPSLAPHGVRRGCDW